MSRIGTQALATRAEPDIRRRRSFPPPREAEIILAHFGPAVDASSSFRRHVIKGWEEDALPPARPRRFHLDFSTDLTREIGSPRWFRGLGVMLGMISVTLFFRPSLAPVAAAVPTTRFDPDISEKFRETTIMPLALGADTGSHMGPATIVTPIASVPERPRIKLVTTLNGQDSFASMLSRAGVGAGDAARISNLVDSSVPLEDITPGTRIAMTLGPRPAAHVPRPLEHLNFRARFDLVLAVDRHDGVFHLSHHPIAVDATPLRIRGTVGHSLALSAYAAGAPMKAIHEYLQTLDAHIGLDSLSPGDTYDMILDYRRAASGESEAGNLLYAGLERSGHSHLRLLRWGGAADDGDGAFIDIDHTNHSHKVSFVMPVVNARVSSSYGLRFHPILGYTRMHEGVDLAVPWGTPIHAMAPGVVSYAGMHGGHGNFVRLEHDGGLGTGYAHMSHIAVTPGEQVRTGQIIGYVGATGLATGPHLHYEVYRDGRTVDPMSIRFTGNAGLGPEDLAAIHARLARLMLVRPGAALAPLKLDATGH